MGLAISNLFTRFFGKKNMRILMGESLSEMMGLLLGLRM